MSPSATPVCGHVVCEQVLCESRKVKVHVTKFHACHADKLCVSKLYDDKLCVSERRCQVV